MFMMWHAFSSHSVLIHHPTSKPSFFILKNNLSFLSALSQSQRSLWQTTCIIIWRCVCVCVASYILIPHCCCLHELTQVIFNHVLRCGFIGRCGGTHTCAAASDILIKSKYIDKLCTKQHKWQTGK